MLAFALVSMNLMPYSTASCRQQIFNEIGKSWLDRANAKSTDHQKLTCSPLVFETCRLSSISHLLPKTIFSTSDDACCKSTTHSFNSAERYEHSYSDLHFISPLCLTSSIFLIQFLILSKDFSFVMSYTSIIPIAPL